MFFFSSLNDLSGLCAESILDVFFFTERPVFVDEPQHDTTRFFSCQPGNPMDVCETLRGQLPITPCKINMETLISFEFHSLPLISVHAS